MSDALVWLAVGVLGGLAAIARFVVDGAVASRVDGGFPLGTFVVNVSGALLLGVLVGAALHGDALLLAGTAVLGSYTTFSTWLFETHRLAEDGDARVMAANVAVSLVAGLAAAAVGRWIAGG